MFNKLLFKKVLFSKQPELKKHVRFTKLFIVNFKVLFLSSLSVLGLYLSKDLALKHFLLVSSVSEMGHFAEVTFQTRVLTADHLFCVVL